MIKQIDLAIVGATGVVGQAMIEILEERNFPCEKVYLLASERSKGKRMKFRNRSLMVEDLSEFDFSKVQVALFSAGGKISEEYAPKAAAKGVIVIDNTSQFRYDSAVPLVIPEVNPEKIAEYKNKNIIANPNCSTIQMLMALKPIYDAVGITRINVATYQSVSGTGKKAIEELAGQTAALLNGQPIKSQVYPLQIAFNLIPQIDEFLENGYTREEMKMVWETQKILDDNTIQVNPTAVRVPVFYGHSEAISIETKEKISAAQAVQLLEKAPGIKVKHANKAKGYPTPVIDAAGKDSVFVGRIREDISCSNGLNLWVVADNIRKGAALNSVQIAESVVRDYL
ncbi:aspartate-semialdehyde dehydrogenase [Candidatus Berkiella cookevillensis]|uniref:Aspartate-semialdehyde dehydrogenase n=1 Tax=Candidatus Berkiella cookevillensis TaxID=437022 RepID=A0A0Q9YFK4_9GAMM|nr:aspartate-semialdehyde dehydrogenase [Candidatus Berkiella cookevillensis]MCS5708916.1 aspartate-semialdehyde dehydrogenase [Candidatus Berkiella cookevillensis]